MSGRRLFSFGDDFVQQHNLNRHDVAVVLCMTANDHTFGVFADELFVKNCARQPFYCGVKVTLFVLGVWM